MRRFRSFLITLFIVFVVYLIAEKLGWSEYFSTFARFVNYLLYFFLVFFLAISLFMKRKDIFSEGSQLVRKRRYEQAIFEFEKEIDLNSRKTSALCGIGYCYFMMGYNRNSIKYYENAFELNPSRVDIYFTLAVIYAEEKSFDKAFEFIERGKVLQRQASIFRKFSKTIMNENEGWVYHLSGDDEKALKKYKKVMPWLNRLLNSWQIKCVEKYAPDYFRMGVIFKLLGKTDKAKKSFERSIKASPPSIFAQKSRDELDQLEKES
jgi:tetratricopeptide (TPR) repeat protein